MFTDEAGIASLDLPTAVAFLMAITALDGIIALTIWNAHRNIRGLATTASGFLAFGIAVYMLPVKSLLLVTVRNTLFNLSTAMAAEGMAQLLGRPGARWLPWSVALFSLIFWPLAQLYIPENLSAQIRTIVSSIISMLLLGWMTWLMLSDRQQTRLLRGVTLVCLAVMMITVGMRFHDAATEPFTEATFYSQQQAWFYFLLCLGSNFLFFCLLVMVGERLSRNLHERNLELREEVQLRGRLQAEVSAALAEHLELREERRRFLQVLGHEIGTPLAIIDRSAEMMQSVPETAAKRLDAIRSAARRLSRLTGDLLDAERACLENLAMRELDAGEVTREAVEMLNLTDSVQMERVDAQPLRFSGDHDLIVMALVNVLNNAVKYTPDDQAISIVLTVDRQQVVIMILDRGIGFPEEERSRVGKRFYRGSNVEAIPGRGLGLHIVWLIMQRHAGVLRVTNREGGGAVVTLSLPVVGGGRGGPT